MYAKDMFHGGFVFVNHASGYLFIWYQVTVSASDTNKDKLLF